ncbi:MAG: Tim44/TimA family putative adaptor protein, partial [Paracoccus sp. (in: a-proteobacteria)]|nr:Tim44/TimA family putative adaptor protein [Paracoccus sp. (in: a-proteobacteria)]
DFLNGSRQAYEMILMAFERGDLSEVRSFLSEPVAQAFQSVIDQRSVQGQTVQAQYLGTRDTALAAAEFDHATGMAEISVRFVGELIAATRDADGNVVEGDPKVARKQKDVWTFARHMGEADPNWQLVATG